MISTLLALSLAGTLVFVFNVRAQPIDVFVDDDFDSSTTGWGVTHFNVIQNGIDAVADYGRVHINDGTYYENPRPNKPLVLQGENPHTTIIDGSNNPGEAVIFAEEHVNIDIVRLTIQNGHYGIYLESCSSCTIAYNTIKKNDVGVYLEFSDDNDIFHNTIRDNIELGIDIWISELNAIYRNNFIFNAEQIYHEDGFLPEKVDLDLGSGGNYWTDYTGNDANNDGIGDTPYRLNDGYNLDSYPYMKENGWATKYAILAAPVHDSDSSKMKKALKREIHFMRMTLLTRGWTDENIIFLTRDDVAKQADDESWIDGDATHDNLGLALDAIARGGTYRFRLTNGTLGPAQNFNPSTLNSFVFIELFDHGSKGGGFCTYDMNDRGFDWRDWWYYNPFARKLDEIEYSKLVLLVHSCYSGKFLSDCSGPGRIIMTATSANQIGYVGLYEFYKAILNLDADGYGGGQLNGRVSVEEAHYYAAEIARKGKWSWFSRKTQDPQISDQIDGAVLGEVYLDHG